MLTEVSIFEQIGNFPDKRTVLCGSDPTVRRTRFCKF
jgi:hypothetical protein